MKARARKLAGWIVATASIIAGIVACEHAHHWRGSSPEERKYLQEMTDPAKADAELTRRMSPPVLKGQELQAVVARSIGCISCHGQTDDPDMHAGRELAISCVDCHGGDGSILSNRSSPGRPEGLYQADASSETQEYVRLMRRAHVLPRNEQAWYGDDLTDGRRFGSNPPKHGTLATRSRNPRVSGALMNHESPEFVRFINPGDLRVADFACGSCHPREVANNRHSMMAHGAMLWGAALYNNGGIPNKIPSYGESYSAFGIAQRLQGVVSDARWDDKLNRLLTTVREPTIEESRSKGVLSYVQPLPVWNVSQPGNILRVFERGSRQGVFGTPAGNDLGNPSPFAEPGRPDKGLSPRGLGTLNRTDPVFLGLQKTRLLDPTLNLIGTNDHPGDFRSSGCTACHTPYANDRDPLHSGAYAAFGNLGKSATIDPTIDKSESGHPIRHVFTKAVPSSQCVVCHIHPGTSFANSYLGYTWWDNESDGERMYPKVAQKPTADQVFTSLRRNPEAASIKGLWSDLYPDAVSHDGVKAGEGFLARIGEPAAQTQPATFNATLEHNQFADFHGHGWVFRAVFKKDRQGNLVTRDGQRIDPADPQKWAKAVHLKDVHLERGMQCVDCHFEQDVHGDGKLYGEVRNAIEITCIDCHGTYDRRSTLRTSGPAAPAGGTDLSKMRVGIRNQKRFYWEDGALYQRSSMDPDVVWPVVQTVDTINPASSWAVKNPDAAKLSRFAKTIRADGKTWGDVPHPSVSDGSQAPSGRLAHSMNNMECYTCHTSWMTSCFGCHLPMKANERTPTLHNESLVTRNFTQYNFQVLRDDVFMLGKDSSVKGGKIVPVRSSSAVVVSSQNQNREWIYHQQQTVSGEGYSGQAFNPHFPHATSGRGTTKQCTDCHLSADNDNNAWMAQLLLQGTNFVNFMGRYVYVAQGAEGLEAVAVTEHDEPQAVYGSRLHALAYPDVFSVMARAGFGEPRVGKGVMLDTKPRLEFPVVLQEAYHHDAGMIGSGNEILDLQLRGEYLYAARGSGGLWVYDVANIDNKGFSERIVSAPVSPLGQRLGFDTKHAVAIASPSTLAVDPARTRLSNDSSKPRAIGMDAQQPWHVNQEQAIHPVYAYLYVGDRQEGLILTSAATLLDGDPTNNFLERAVLVDGSTAFNPKGVLTGLTSLTLAGHLAYATSAAGLVIIDLDQPLSPRIVSVVGGLRDARSVAVQLRYAFVTDATGLRVVDVTDPSAPVLCEEWVALPEAHRVYVAREYAFVAAGAQGLAIVNITNPAAPVLIQKYNADGLLDDTRDVKVAMTNASLFAYVADGKNGLAVVRLMGPESTAQFRGFSPPLSPRLIAVRKTPGPALAISKGLDRDRAVDETGHQIAVFGRLGARPMNAQEMRRMYLRDGKVWTVTNSPATDPLPWKDAEPSAGSKPTSGEAELSKPAGPRRPGQKK